VSARARIAAAGAGRMGRGIAVAFAYAGHAVDLVDLKPRTAEARDRIAAEARAEIATTLRTLAALGAMPETLADTIASRVSIHPAEAAADILPSADVVFEGVPETIEAKRDAFAFISKAARANAIVASTTSTILADDLQPFVDPPGRFLNCHWLNPAYLVPLVEVSPGALTDADTTRRLVSILESAGKIPVVCKSSPGFIVPRIQALAMNEAARLVEEGVASAEDIDKATKYGFGFRFAVLGLCEFIDYGGGDILAYASRYLARAMDDPRFTAPKIVEDNMASGRIGMRSREGLLDWSGVDVEAYRRDVLARFVSQLRHMGALRPPVP